MPRRQVFIALAIGCFAIALLLARGRQPGTAPSVLQEPQRIIPGGSPPVGAAPERVPVAVATSVVQAPATTVSPSAVLAGPSPAVRAVAARQALERFGRDATFEIERCAGAVNGARALFPVQIVARPLPAGNGDLQPFMVVHATAMPAVAHGAAPTRATPEAERCLAMAVVGHPLFIPRSATPAAEFQHVLTLQLPALHAQKL
jgi:hypothetical protein